jgi:DivIVA domain-containing protein
VPDAEIADLRDVQFPAALRGYDRAEVDRFVARVNQVLAELQITAAPESAIRHALKQVSEETQGILERAHETAEEITRRSRSQADDRLQRAETEAREVSEAAAQQAREMREAAAEEAREVREAAAEEARDVRASAADEARELREAAEARVADLEADVQRIVVERARIIEELRDLVRRLGDFSEAAAGRDPSRPPSSEDD